MKRTFPYLLIAAAALGAAGHGSAQPAKELPGIRPADDLELVESHVFELDGEVLADAEIYYSAFEAFYLVLAPELEAPLMVSPRGQSVQSVDGEKFSRDGEIGATLGAGAAREHLGRYEPYRDSRDRYRDSYVFELNGQKAKLALREPLLGRQSSDSMKRHHRRYAHKARSHRPKRDDLRQMPVRPGDVLVRVFFGSWSPVCERIVPKVMRFEEELRGPAKKVRFEYFGLPRRVTEDELAKKEGVYGVPLAIVYVDGEEVARLRALELDHPEENLLPLLTP